jgi:hypothetical protein
MTGQAGEVVRSVTSLLPSASATHRFEVLFESKFIALMLLELARAQRLVFDEPDSCLLTVIRGRLRMHGPDGSFILQDTGRWRLERGTRWRIRAMSEATITLLVARTHTIPQSSNVATILDNLPEATIARSH